MTAPAAARPRLSREQQLERELRIAELRLLLGLVRRGRSRRGRRWAQLTVARGRWLR